MARGKPKGVSAGEFWEDKYPPLKLTILDNGVTYPAQTIRQAFCGTCGQPVKLEHNVPVVCCGVTYRLDADIIKMRGTIHAEQIG
jgi:hypothetical protein